ncbi:MAG: SDR family NAD(P)-dependent oxidoreductase, partial [Myxococcota bacterium]
MTERIALVQGASRGLGLAFARLLLADPSVAHVVATSRRPEQAPELMDLASSAGGRLSTQPLDVTDEASIAAAAAAV